MYHDNNKTARVNEGRRVSSKSPCHLRIILSTFMFGAIVNEIDHLQGCVGYQIKDLVNVVTKMASDFI